MFDRLLRFFTSLRLTVVLLAFGIVLVFVGTVAQADEGLYNAQARYFKHWFVRGDRKSTRLNSSHGYISYAVFCLKKKKISHESTAYVLLSFRKDTDSDSTTRRYHASPSASLPRTPCGNTLTMIWMSSHRIFSHLPT